MKTLMKFTPADLAWSIILGMGSLLVLALVGALMPSAYATHEPRREPTQSLLTVDGTDPRESLREWLSEAQNGATGQGVETSSTSVTAGRAGKALP